MKKTLILTFMVFILTGIVNAQLKIAFVDSQKILKDLPSYQDAQKKLDDLQKQYQDTITYRENSLKTEYENFRTKYEDAQSKSETMKPDEIKKMETELQGMQAEIQKEEQDLNDYKQGVRETLIVIEQNLLKPIMDTVKNVINKIAQDPNNKFNIVLDKTEGSGVIYSDSSMDITYLVLDRLTKK